MDIGFDGCYKRSALVLFSCFFFLTSELFWWVGSRPFWSALNLLENSCPLAPTLRWQIQSTALPAPSVVMLQGCSENLELAVPQVLEEPQKWLWACHGACDQRGDALCWGSSVAALLPELSTKHKIFKHKWDCLHSLRDLNWCSNVPLPRVGSGE